MYENFSNEKFKQKLLDVLKYVQGFLERHDLHYVGCAGTVLGAVRHHNIIPWDDDIDIYLPRKEYEKLLDLKDEANREGYDIVSLRDKGYYLPFAKIFDKKTTLWEDKKTPFLIGVFVDVFPLDYFPFSDKEIKKIQQRAYQSSSFYGQSLYRIPTWDWWLTLLKGDKETTRLKLRVMWRRMFSRQLEKSFLDYQKWYSGFDGDKCVCATQWVGKVFRREWFDDTIDCPFGDTTIKIPRDYDSYLRLAYGDYMQLPPEDKRRSGHSHYYLNLEERLSLEEVKKRIEASKTNK